MKNYTAQKYSSFTDLIESTQEPIAEQNNFIAYITAFFTAMLGKQL